MMNDRNHLRIMNSSDRSAQAKSPSLNRLRDSGNKYAPNRSSSGGHLEGEESDRSVNTNAMINSINNCLNNISNHSSNNNNHKNNNSNSNSNSNNKKNSSGINMNGFGIGPTTAYGKPLQGPGAVPPAPPTSSVGKGSGHRKGAGPPNHYSNHHHNAHHANANNNSNSSSKRNDAHGNDMSVRGKASSRPSPPTISTEGGTFDNNPVFHTADSPVFQSPKTIGQTSPLSSTMSTMTWTAPSQSLTILDWDDTLFPSTWLTETNLELLSPCPPNRQDVLEPMAMHAQRIIELIQAAKRVSRVVILTNASAGWVHDAVRNFMPIPALLREIDNTPIIYAREEWARVAPDYMMDVYSMYEHHDDEEPLPMSWKKVAMEKVLREFYGPEHSWKNVLGIGDSPIDRWALDEVCVKHNNPTSGRSGMARPMRVKTIKVIESPSIQLLQAEVMLLTKYFHGLLLADGTFEMDILFQDQEEGLWGNGPLRWNPAGKHPDDPKKMLYQHDPMIWHNYMRANPRTVQTLFDNFETLFDPRVLGDLIAFSQLTPARTGYAAAMREQSDRRFSPYMDNSNNNNSPHHMSSSCATPPAPPPMMQPCSSPIPPGPTRHRRPYDKDSRPPPPPAY